MRRHVSSGAPWEAVNGYCRAVRVGGSVFVAGTTAVGAEEADAYGQAVRALEIIRAALEEAGASMGDVVRTRMFVRDIAANREAVGRAHGEVFRDVRPAATMVEVSGLYEPWMLVEIEADAVVEG